jgi:DNA helicase INO80
MPTLFDSHEEFNEWFSKDIESHAENKSAIDESKYCCGFPLFV